MHFRTATQLVSALERREISACELLDLYLSRVDRYNANCNAIVAVDIERATKAAAESDQRRAGHQALGALDGIPMTIKDCFEVTGMPTACGLPALANHVPERDADAVVRLRTAGATIFGKTNVPALTADYQSENALYGVTRNPWNLDCTPGGSSGGAAASIAAGLAALELGGDIAGSIRVPSHFCGVFGHKPSYGIVPLRGHIPPMPGTLHAPQLQVAGPIARGASDLALALRALTDNGENGSAGWILKLPPARCQKLNEFRAAVWMGDDLFPLDDGCRHAIERYLADLRRLGLKVFKAAPPIDMTSAFQTYLHTLFAVFSVSLPAPDESPRAVPPTGRAREYAERIAKYSTTSYSEWHSLSNQREHLFVAFSEFFKSFDVLICPIAPTVAFPHFTERDHFARFITVNGVQHPYFDMMLWPSLALNANLPATAMPTGQLVNGLPCGVQIIGPYLGDYTTIRFAELAERELGGFRPPPRMP